MPAATATNLEISHDSTSPLEPQAAAATNLDDLTSINQERVAFVKSLLMNARRKSLPASTSRPQIIVNKTQVFDIHSC